MRVVKRSKFFLSKEYKVSKGKKEKHYGQELQKALSVSFSSAVKVFHF
jgi:hypothetical protein